MRINIRVYKRWDLDLLALIDAGYPFKEMLSNSIISFAKGEPLFYYIDELTDFITTNKNSLSFKLNIPSTEVEATYLLQHAKPNQLNLLCKSILRNSLISQNLGCLFTDPNLAQLININNNYRKMMTLQNVIPLSSIKREKTVEIKPLNKTIKIENPKATSLTSMPFVPIVSQTPIQPVRNSRPIDKSTLFQSQTQKDVVQKNNVTIQDQVIAEVKHKPSWQDNSGPDESVYKPVSEANTPIPVNDQSNKNTGSASTVAVDDDDMFLDMFNNL